MFGGKEQDIARELRERAGANPGPQLFRLRVVLKNSRGRGAAAYPEERAGAPPQLPFASLAADIAPSTRVMALFFISTL